MSAAGVLRAAKVELSTVDARTLGLFRIAYALLLLFDLAKRYAGLEYWYAEDGFLPTELVQRTHPHAWSFFFGLESVAAIHAAFAACALVYLALLLGTGTKLAQLLVLPCVLSLQHRAAFVMSGGDLVIVALAWWTVVLPLGGRFSVDALLANRANRPSPQVGGTVHSLAVTGLLLQLSIIYYFTGVQKSGETWTNGTAIHYVLWLDRLTTPLAVWMRGILSPFGSEVLTYASRAIELALPLFVLSPFGRRWTRRIAIVLVFGLHGGIALMLNVGVFSAAMIVFSTLLVGPDDWRLAARWFPKLAETRESTRDDPPAERRPLARFFREAYAAVLLLIVLLSALSNNPLAVPEGLRPNLPDRLVRAVDSGHLRQGWWMFAPEVSKFEMTVIVDAVTVDGRHVDPYNQKGARVADPLLRHVSPQMGYGIYWNKYTLSLSERPELHPALRRWLLAHHERTGREEDRIVELAAVAVVRASPPPGEDYPRPDSQRILFSMLE